MTVKVPGMHCRTYLCPEGKWEMAWMRPSAELAGTVIEYAGYRESAGRVLREREVAELVVPLIINFGPAFHITLGGAPSQSGRCCSFAAGLYAGYVDVAGTGACYCMQIDFTPLGAYRFFRLPMCELTGRVITLDDILGHEIDRLTERLFEARNWDARFHILDRFVRIRVAETEPPSRAIRWAWRQLANHHGALQIGALACELGWSRKHLAARFRAEIGETPKTIARMLRFDRARKALGGHASPPDLAGLAAECGYADQAHLTREFRDLAGAPPAAFYTSAATHEFAPALAERAR